MDFALIFKYVEVVFREVWQRKFLCLLGFGIVSYVVLGVGMFWPSKFETSATIFADNQNILKPLLSNSAAQSNVQNQTKVVAEMLHSPRILTRVVEDLYDVQNFESAEELGQKITSLRRKIKVKGVGSNYIKVSYSAATSSEAYKTINSVIDVFISASSEDQRSESREAFLFIDNQVKQYKDQLVLAEEKLKIFTSQNFDGRNGDVDSNIARLRSQLEDLRISIDEDRTTINSLEKQLANESEFTSSRLQADMNSGRLAELERQRNNLLLTYTEDYPDVQSLTLQIADLKKSIKEASRDDGASTARQASDDDSVLNPLYQELRSRLSLVQTEIKAKEKRLIAFQKLLDQEYSRRKRIAERAAEEAELTRDYNVTMRIYEDMLERKEKARLSMTLNVEGQGVTYRIQEPALPPLNPIGLRFMHFVIAGPFAGLFFVLGLVVLFVLVDKRIRFPEALAELSVPTLAVVPHVRTPFTKRIKRIDIIVCFIVGSLIMAGYIGLAYASKLGLLGL